MVVSARPTKKLAGVNEIKNVVGRTVDEALRGRELKIDSICVLKLALNDSTLGNFN